MYVIWYARGRGCGELCGKVLARCSLLFADDTVLLAGNAKDIKRSLQCLQTWYERWSVEANVERSAVMHMRIRGMGRCSDSFSIDKDEIPLVPTCKYLVCVVDEFLDCSSMVEHRVKLDHRHWVWLWRCRESVGEVSGI